VRRLGRWGIVLSAVSGVCGILALLAVTAWAAGAPPFQPNSPYQTAAQKQAQLQQMHAQETADANSPHGPKTGPARSTPITSCPSDPVTSSISTALETGALHEHIISNATVAPDGGVPFIYRVYAGSLVSNLQQGVIIVRRFDYDPCSPDAKGTTITYYPTPYQQGAVTLTQVNDATLTFTTESGGSGHFNVVTGKYSS
jgi:hypothetical protein